MARNPTVAGEGLPARYGFRGGEKTPNTRPFPRFAGNAGHKMPQDHCIHCIALPARLPYWGRRHSCCVNGSQISA